MNVLRFVFVKKHALHEAEKPIFVIVGAIILCLVAIFNNTLQAEGKMSLTLTSTAFANGDSIPGKFTCQGNNISPPLRWQGVPQGARSLALIVDDPDAPDPRAPRVTWVHWVVYNLPVNVFDLPEDMAAAKLPPGVTIGLNDWGNADYGGPCPPVGKHRYFFKLYALNTELKSADHLTKSQLEAEMEGHILSQAELVGTYQQSR